VEARLQRRVQRYGWDLAARDYERLWHAQLAPAQQAMLEAARLCRGERVLDVACGTGLVAVDAAGAVGPEGRVLGVDLSGRMVEAAQRRAQAAQLPNLRFERMDAEALALPDAGVDVVLCALGLMYVPDVRHALREMRRVLRPGGRVALAVWGERAGCGWADVFAIVDAEVRSDVCPLFFRLGQAGSLADECTRAGFGAVQTQRIAATLAYESAEDACAAAFVGGPVALAWSRFDGDARERVCRRYLEAIDPWRDGRGGYRLPGEFVVVAGQAPGVPEASPRAAGAR
jgi:ubiquinone/menaquinone biosynthesis C-methylase UbiE